MARRFPRARLPAPKMADLSSALELMRQGAKLRRLHVTASKGGGLEYYIEGLGQVSEEVAHYVLEDRRAQPDNDSFKWGTSQSWSFRT